MNTKHTPGPVRFDLYGHRPEYGTGVQHSIVRAVITALRDIGWKVNAFNCPGEDTVKVSSTRAALDAVFAVDDGTLVFTCPGSKYGPHGVYFYLSNDGAEIISDYSCASPEFEACVASVSDEADRIFGKANP